MSGTATALTFNAGTGHTITANAAAQGLGFTTGTQTSGPGSLATVSALNIVGATGVESFTLSTTGGTFPTFNVASSVESTVLNTAAFSTGAGSQTYNGPVLLMVNATLTSTGSGNITLASTVNGAFSLTVNTAGFTIFDGAVGAPRR
jgi:hypothetical protein